MQRRRSYVRMQAAVLMTEGSRQAGEGAENGAGKQEKSNSMVVKALPFSAAASQPLPQQADVEGQ